MPGAPASSAAEATDATPQRLAAALGDGSAPTRSDSTVTPDVSAASISRRVAVRSIPGARPQASINSVPSPVHRAASAAARNKAASSATTTTTIRSASSPSSASPVACSLPACRSHASVRIHTKGKAPAASASAIANPAPLAASP